MLKRILKDITTAYASRLASITKSPRATIERGHAELAADQPERALAAAKSTLDAKVTDEAALELLVAAANATHRYDEAIVLLERAAQAGAANAYRMLGNVYRKRGQADAAITALEQAARMVPNDHRTWNELGIVNLELGKSAEARSHFTRALAIAPNLAEAHCNLGIIALVELDLDSGIASLRQSLALDPGLVEARCTLGFALFSVGHMADAERTFADALAQAPEHPLARTYYAFFLLGRREWRQGWMYFEDRLRVSPPPIVFRHPRWQGESLSGKHVLVHGEQGLGDQIMFASCLPDLLARGCACSLDLDRRLARLMARAFPGCEVLGDTHDDRRYGYEIAIGSLPRYFRDEASAFPRRRAYLRPDPIRVTAWKDRLRALGAGLKIGVSWRGGTLGTRRALRSIPIARLARALQLPGVHLVSLQYGDCANELADVEANQGITVTHWPDAIDDYDETAALVCALDLVISVCTSVVHLSGALGQCTWVLAPANAEWRYGFTGTTMPWYSSTEIYRQRDAGDWQTVLDDVSTRLATLRDENGGDHR